MVSMTYIVFENEDMKHEINEKTLIVKDCSETFETIY